MCPGRQTPCTVVYPPHTDVGTSPAAHYHSSLSCIYIHEEHEEHEEYEDHEEHDELFMGSSWGLHGLFLH